MKQSKSGDREREALVPLIETMAHHHSESDDEDYSYDDDSESEQEEEEEEEPRSSRKKRGRSNPDHSVGSARGKKRKPSGSIFIEDDVIVDDDEVEDEDDVEDGIATIYSNLVSI